MAWWWHRRGALRHARLRAPQNLRRTRLRCVRATMAGLSSSLESTVSCLPANRARAETFSAIEQPTAARVAAAARRSPRSMVLIRGGNAASAPALLPSIVPASPPRTAPAPRWLQKGPPRSPPSTSIGDPSHSGYTGLQQWMEELSGFESGPIGGRWGQAELPSRSSARSHRPVTCEPPSRSTSHFALLISGRPAHLTPDNGVFDALLGGQHKEHARPHTRGCMAQHKADLKKHTPDKVLLRQVKHAKPQRPPSQEVRATQLGVSSGDNTAVLGHAVKMNITGKGALAELTHVSATHVSWNAWAPPLRRSESELIRSGMLSCPPVDELGRRRVSGSLRSGAAIPFCRSSGVLPFHSYL